jgi:hypothetical protein
VASNSKDSGRSGRLEKAAQEGASATALYEAEARAMRDKTARLRELRLARDAAEGIGTAAPKKAATVKKAGKEKKKKPVPLSDFLDSQTKGGHRG